MIVKRTPRSVYEGMTRGELIDALAKVESEPAPGSVRRTEELETARAALEEEMRLLRERSERAEIARVAFADLFTNAPLAYCVLDRNGTIRDANDAAATLFCTTAAALDGAQLTNIAAVKERQTLSNHIERCLDEKLRVSSELSMTVRGRGDVSVQIVSSPRVREDGRADACRTLLHDVTRERRALRVSEFLAQLDDVLADAMETNNVPTAIARACVPMLGDAVFVDLLCDDGALLRRAGLAIEPQQAEAREAMVRHAEDPAWHTYVRRVLDASTAVFEPASAVAFSTTFRAKAFLLVPLDGRHRPLGVLGALRMEEGAYTVEQFELAHRLAQRAARTIETARALVTRRTSLARQHT